MPANLPESEFGGKVQDNTLHPKLANLASAADVLRAVYRTGTEDVNAVLDGGKSWTGTSEEDEPV